MTPLVRSVLSRIAVGFLTPALAMLIFLAASLAQHPYSLSKGGLSGFPTLIELAVALGAPFSIVVLLLVRLRNSWRALPILAVAAAIGIELQFLILGLDLAFHPPIFLWIWIVPATLGTCTALLFKWYEKRTLIATTKAP